MLPLKNYLIETGAEKTTQRIEKKYFTREAEALGMLQTNNYMLKATQPCRYILCRADKTSQGKDGLFRVEMQRPVPAQRVELSFNQDGADKGKNLKIH